jgi:hypothetical protein
MISRHLRARISPFADRVPLVGGFAKIPLLKQNNPKRF